MPRQFLDPELYRHVRIRSRGYLPHWEVENAIYSLTFRERDSLPEHVRLRLREQNIAIRRSIAGDRRPTAIENAEIRRRFELRLDAELDCGYGRCRLRDLAPITAEALRFFDGQRYDLFGWSVMPNHVHVVLTAREPLGKILHSWKSYVAHKAGEKIFQREYYDRIIRDEKDLENTVAYVRANPLKAGLAPWPWIG
jgi:putative transposase